MELSRRAFLLGAAVGAICGCRRLPPVAASVRFGAVTDCHYADRETAIGRYYRLAKDKLARSVELFNARKVDFVIELGDFKDAGSTPAETLAYLDSMEAAFARFRGPRYHVLGNHDADTITKDEFLAHVKNAGQARARAQYSFERGGVKFIVLDANYRADGVAYARGNYNWREAVIPAAELDWLRAELGAANGPAVVFCHQRLDGDGDELSVGNAGAVRKILEDSGRVIGVLQGHDHRGDEKHLNGIAYHTLPAVIAGATLAENPRFEITVSAEGTMKVERLP